MFNKSFYEEKLKRLTQKNQRLLQEYINYGIQFGQNVAEINMEIQEVNKIIAENTKEKEAKKVDNK